MITTHSPGESIIRSIQFVALVVAKGAIQVVESVIKLVFKIAPRLICLEETDNDK